MRSYSLITDVVLVCGDELFDTRLASGFQLTRLLGGRCYFASA